MKIIWLGGKRGGKRYEYSELTELTQVFMSAGIKVGRGVTFGDEVSIGNGVSIGHRCRIGEKVSIGYRCRIEISPMYIASDLPYIFNGYHDRIQIGCKDYTVNEWLENYRDIAASANITDECVIQKYFAMIQFYNEHFKKQN